MTAKAAQKPPPSLRDARKVKTRRALRDAALKLFATRGYDATLTEDIAEKAGVSARTFFRYFPTKESILFSAQDPWFQSLSESFLSQSHTLSDCDAIRNAFIALTPSVVDARVALRLRERSIATSPTLRGLKVDHHEQNVNQLAAAIGIRRGLDQPDEGCVLLASIGVLTHHRALERWLTGPAELDLPTAIEDEFKLLVRSFAKSQLGNPAKAAPAKAGKARARVRGRT